MKPADPIRIARRVLLDPAGRAWPDAELLDYFNVTATLIASLRPDAVSATGTVMMVEGTRQTLSGLNPAPERLLDPIRDPDTGRAVRVVDREALDAGDPNWHSRRPGQVKSVAFDGRDPLTFFVYPPAAAGSRLEVLYQRLLTPVALADINANASPISDAYLDPMVNGILFRAYSKDADDTQNAGLAAAYKNLFDAFFGAKTAVDMRSGPDMNSPGAAPSRGLAAGGV